MRNTVAVCLLGLAVLVAGAPESAAQITVLNPRIVEFDPSPDHNTILPNSVPVVRGYELQFYLLGGTQAVVVTDLGKPGPEADGKIRVDFTSRLGGWPPNGDYEARVAAVGPAGAGRSDTSNPFSFQMCTLSLGASSQAFSAAGGASTVPVTTSAGCAWGATSTAAWIGLGASTGSGPGSVPFTVAANAGTTARTGTLLIGGATFTVTQAAAAPACTYTLSPAGVVVGGNGNSGNFTVTCTTGCAWTVTKSHSWITLNKTAGSSSGTVSYSIARNTSGTPRTGTIVVGGQTFTITQGIPSRPSAPKKPRVVIQG